MLAIWHQRESLRLLLTRESLRLSPRLAAGQISWTMLLTFGMSLLLLPLIEDLGNLVAAERTASEVLRKCIVTLPRALLIGAAEEIFFRGVLLRKVSEVISTGYALISVSLLYAVLHFFSAERGFVFVPGDFTQGVTYFLLVLRRAFPLDAAPALFGMFLIGMTLGAVYLRKGKLYHCIGLHAGWILAHKLSLFLTLEAPYAKFAEGVGRRYYLISQPIVWGSIALVAVIMLWRVDRHDLRK